MCDPSARTQLVSFVQTFVDDQSAESLDGVVEPMQNMVNGTLSAFRALLALVAPKAGTATLVDMRYVFPKNATTAVILTDIPKQGRSLLAALKKDRSGFWQPAMQHFLSCIGSMEQIATPYPVSQ